MKHLATCKEAAADPVLGSQQEKRRQPQILPLRGRM